MRDALLALAWAGVSYLALIILALTLGWLAGRRLTADA